ncbi:unnamed protein product [Calypogeia fissa]
MRSGRAAENEYQNRRGKRQPGVRTTKRGGAQRARGLEDGDERRQKGELDCASSAPSVNGSRSCEGDWFRLLASLPVPRKCMCEAVRWISLIGMDGGRGRPLRTQKITSSRAAGNTPPWLRVGHPKEKSRNSVVQSPSSRHQNEPCSAVQRG